MLTNLEFENLGGLIGVEKLNSSLKFSGTLASKSAGDIIDSQMHLLSSLHAVSLTLLNSSFVLNWPLSAFLRVSGTATLLSKLKNVN